MAEEVKEIIQAQPVKQVEATSLVTEVPVQSDEIDINPKEKPKHEKTRVNIRDNSYIKKIVDTPKENSSSAKETVSDIKARLASENTSTPIEPASESDSDSTADLIVEVLDWLLVAGIHWYSLDESDKDYKTDANNKKTIKKHLAKYLLKKQAKYPVEFFLIVAFLSTYIIAGRKAYSKRQEVKEQRASKPRSDQREERKKRRVKDSIVEEATILD